MTAATKLAAAVALAAAPAACHRSAEPAGGGTDDGTAWHVQDVPECAFTVELPAEAQRSDATLDGGVRAILYLASAPPEKYIIGCNLVPAAITVPSPADALRAQLASHETVLRQAVGDISDVGVEDADDGGRYWIAFPNGLRIEGRVHVVGRQVRDLSGSLDPRSAASRAALDRVLASYRPR